jgi:hypothetical protein
MKAIKGKMLIVYSGLTEVLQHNLLHLEKNSVSRCVILEYTCHLLYTNRWITQGSRTKKTTIKFSGEG